MELWGFLFLFLNLQAFQAETYTCKHDEYRDVAKGWKEILSPYCNNLINNLSSEASKCINDENPIFPDAVSKCQAIFNRPPISVVNYMQDFCATPLKNSELYVCCLTEKVLKAGAALQDVKTVSCYTGCLEKFVNKSS